MEHLPPDVWLRRCATRISEVERDIPADEARRLARALKGFERTAAMPPEAAVDFVARAFAQPERQRFERRVASRG